MQNIAQIQELLDQQVAAQTDEFLVKLKPEIAVVVRAEVMRDLERIIEERVHERLTAMRSAAAQATRTAFLHELTTGESTEPVIQISTRKPLTPDMVHDILTKALDPITAARGIKKAGKKWACAFCDTKYNTQRAATMHSRKCDKRADILAASQQPVPTVKTLKKKRQNGVVKKTGKRVKRECIKPDCAEPSKGPRYHHLCGKHEKAPSRHVQAWQRKVRETHAE